MNRIIKYLGLGSMLCKVLGHKWMWNGFNRIYIGLSREESMECGRCGITQTEIKKCEVCNKEAIKIPVEYFTFCSLECKDKSEGRCGCGNIHKPFEFISKPLYEKEK